MLNYGYLRNLRNCTLNCGTVMSQNLANVNGSMDDIHRSFSENLFTGESSMWF